MSTWIKRILYSILVIIGIPVILVIVFIVGAEQQKENHPQTLIPVDSYEAIVKELDLDSLQKAVGENKLLPEGYELQALIALSAYPELKDIQVSFVLNTESAPMEANFDFWSLWGNRKKRHYRILLNIDDSGFESVIRLQNLPFDAQVGILSHELGHVVYYHRLNLLQIGHWGLNYLLNPSYRGKHERSTDRVPVWRGLGNQIYKYSYHIRHSSQTQDLYEQFGDFADLFYMNDEEIADLMKATGIYTTKK